MSKIPEKDWIKVKIEDAIIPHEGYTVIMDRWWSVKDGYIFYYRYYTCPQCNSNKDITERLGEKHGRTPQFIPIVYQPHNCNDYVR